jgi:hypothetical protein
MHSCRCIFSFVLVCALVFYFANRSYLKLELKEFEFFKAFAQWKAFFLVSYGHGPKPSHRGPGNLPLRLIQVAARSS